LDHLVLAQLGLIPQISGKLTAMQVNGATVFVDHCFDHVYVFLMQDLTLDETILAKHAYEQFLSSIGVTSKAYHANNGCFADKGFRDDCILQSNHNFLRCWWSSSKWYCRMKDQRINTRCLDTASSCKTNASRVHFNNSMALCTQVL
jgi:hypothetical protein